MNAAEREIWVKADRSVSPDWERLKARVTASLESGVDVILVDEEDVAKVRELGRIKVAAFVKPENAATPPSFDASVVEAEGEAAADILVFGKDGEGDGSKPLPEDFEDSEVLASLRETRERKNAAYVEMLGKEYENFALKLAEYCNYIIIVGKDWKIIPLENIIAALQGKDVKIIAGVKTAEETRTAFETLEHGADGVLLDTDDPSEIKKAVAVREELKFGRIPLTVARVTRVKPLEMGERVCVDTCSLMRVGEGMLVGSQSSALFLVHSETEESPYVEARPFRVNAGAVHSYILVGEKTKYLAEISAGDEVLIVNAEGKARKAVVGRAKIERRPLMLVEAEVQTAEGEKRKCSVILQNAETIKLVRKDGKPVSVVSLKEGDEVLVHLPETAGRHFGTAVEETVIEK